MAQEMFECKFHNVVPNLIPRVNFEFEVDTQVNEDERTLSCLCSATEVEKIRSKMITRPFGPSSLWFSIKGCPEQIVDRNDAFEEVEQIDQVLFGALFSNEIMFTHSTLFDQDYQWKLMIKEGKRLILEATELGNSALTIVLWLSMNHIQKDILIVENTDHSDIIFGFDLIHAEARMNASQKSENLTRKSRFVTALTRNSEVLISISSKSQANKFIDYLRYKSGQYRLFYTMLSIERFERSGLTEFYDSFSQSEAGYGFAMLHSLGYLFDDKFLGQPHLASKLCELAQTNARLFYRFAEHAYEQLKNCHWIDLLRIFDSEDWQSFAEENVQANGIMISAQVVHLTPTRLMILPKEVKKGNRALRHPAFGSSDNFCLVYLKPDPPNVYFNETTDMNKAVQEIFEKGIDICGQRFYLFGSSNSQLKERSFWFLRGSSKEDVHEKRQLLGRFDEIHNIGKYFSRLGLWFSTTDPTMIKLTFCSNERQFEQLVGQKQHCVMMIDDIEHNNYCFTDGNGLVSRGLSRLLSRNILDLAKYESDPPSAYQIRVAGCKGLIITDINSRDDEYYIKIRPSMKKFECDDWKLDVCDYSRPTSTRLNNQIIWLMSDLGVPDQAFFDLQRRFFDNSNAALIETDNVLKNKIPLPVNECRYMFGCSLNSRLREGECFIRYQVLGEDGKTLTKPTYECVTGPVVVTKNPCPYAGDMLKLTAVDIPELHDLIDVIVFSVSGDRPDSNKIAGSDLDGDGYFVYWGTELRIRDQERPLDYKPHRSADQHKVFSADDVIKYCLSTVGYSTYGEIYNIHQVIVDKNLEGATRRTCQKDAIKLALMFSAAIDAAKTGYEINRNELWNFRGKIGNKSPDFLQKDPQKTYISTSIVGKLYRRGCEFLQSLNAPDQSSVSNLINTTCERSSTNQFESYSSRDGDNSLRVINSFSYNKPLLVPSSTTENSLDQKLSSLYLSERIDRPSEPQVSCCRLPDKVEEFSLQQARASIEIDYGGSIREQISYVQQLVLLDGFFSFDCLINFCPATDECFPEHTNLKRLRLELPMDIRSRCSPPLCTFFNREIQKLDLKPQDQKELVVSFGNFYTIQFDQVSRLAEKSMTLYSFTNNFLIPPVSDTFLPTTVLDLPASTESSQRNFQQIFFRSNVKIRQEFFEMKDIMFPWFRMKAFEKQKEIILICIDNIERTEVLIHFNENGHVQSIKSNPNLYMKSFHQQSTTFRPDLLYEIRGWQEINSRDWSKFLKNQNNLDSLDPTKLPIKENLVPLIIFTQSREIYEFEETQLQIIQINAPVKYVNDKMKNIQSVLGYFQTTQRFCELHFKIDKKIDLNLKKLRLCMSVAHELAQMLEYFN